VLPYRDQRDRSIYLIRLGLFVYGEFSPEQVMQVDDLWLMPSFCHGDLLARGIVLLVDLQAMRMRLLRYATPYYITSIINKVSTLPTDNYSVHIFNGNVIMDLVIPLVFPFLNDFLKARVFFHRSLESLHDHVTPDHLPEEYGGLRPSPDHRAMVQEFFADRRQWLEQITSYGYRDGREDTGKE